MTESEWVECNDPKQMLGLLSGKVSDRKLRLFACACCRRVEYLLQGDYVKGSRTAIKVLEEHVEGLKSDQELQAAWGNAAADALDAASAVAHPAETNFYAISYAADAVDYIRRSNFAASTQAAAGAVGYDALSRHANPTVDEITASWKRGLLGTPQWQADEATVRKLPDYEKAVCVEQANQAGLLRCIVGPIAFHPLPFADQAWLTWNDGTVANLARLIYDDRRFENMPILADALEDAGCTNGCLLAHCRQEGEHVRGCWVVDLILGKK